MDTAQIIPFPLGTGGGGAASNALGGSGGSGGPPSAQAQAKAQAEDPKGPSAQSLASSQRGDLRRAPSAQEVAGGRQAPTTDEAFEAAFDAVSAAAAPPRPTGLESSAQPRVAQAIAPHSGQSLRTPAELTVPAATKGPAPGNVSPIEVAATPTPLLTTEATTAQSDAETSTKSSSASRESEVASNSALRSSQLNAETRSPAASPLAPASDPTRASVQANAAKTLEPKASELPTAPSPRQSAQGGQGAQTVGLGETPSVEVQATRKIEGLNPPQSTPPTPAPASSPAALAPQTTAAGTAGAAAAAAETGLDQRGRGASDPQTPKTPILAPHGATTAAALPTVDAPLPPPGPGAAGSEQPLPQLATADTALRGGSTGALTGSSTVTTAAGSQPGEFALFIGTAATDNGPAGDTSANRLRELNAIHVLRLPDGRVELQLDPPELGRVEITFDFSDDGLRATVAGERAGTIELLRRHADLLLGQLRAAGFENTTLDLADGKSSGQRGSSSGDPQLTPLLPEREGEAQPAPGRRGLAAGHVDLRL
ncbi:MAG: flagellar hook-length control protein FliK [Pseudomonadota bacterium]